MKSIRLAGLAAAGCLMAMIGTANLAAASPSLVVDVKTGSVLEHVEATRPWYPASLTKLLTVYIALSAVRDGKVSMNTPFVVSALAASMPPSKMGFKPGTEVTLNNVLKMLMVKSANDLAVTLAEGISGSVEDFAAKMNRTAARLGMKDSHFVNPNGLPNPDHYSSARDIAIVARALFRDFPQDAWLYDIGAFRLGRLVVDTYNNMLGRYPGVNGMKTGYTCASGFNIVVSDTRGGRHLIAVVMGEPTIKQRTAKAAELLDAAFEGVFPDGPQLDALPKSRFIRPPDIRAEVCGRHRKIVADDDLPPQLRAGPVQPAPGGLPPAASEVNLAVRPHFVPIPVFVGPDPGWTGPVAQARGSPKPVSVAVPERRAEAAPRVARPHLRPLNLSSRAGRQPVRKVRHWKHRRRHIARTARRRSSSGHKGAFHRRVATRGVRRKTNTRRFVKSPYKARVKSRVQSARRPSRKVRGAIAASAHGRSPAAE